jgi:hypothetical protein
MTVTLARWLDEHPAPTGLAATLAHATADGPYRVGVERVEVLEAVEIPLRPSRGDKVRMAIMDTAGVVGALALDFTLFIAAGTSLGLTILGRRAVRRRRVPCVVIEGTRASLSGFGAAHELDLAEVSACRFVDLAARHKTLGTEPAVELVASGESIIVWRGPREQVAWIADLLAAAIAEARGGA